jgi:hypothetical protein
MLSIRLRCRLKNMNKDYYIFAQLGLLVKKANLCMRLRNRMDLKTRESSLSLVNERDSDKLERSNSKSSKLM